MQDEKKVDQMANLSVPSPGKWILDIFGTHLCRHFFGIGISNMCSKKKKKTDLRWLLKPKCQCNCFCILILYL